MRLSERVGGHLRGNAVGYLALFIALTGTSYAATKIGPGDIKKNAVLAKHVKDGVLTGAEVADNALTGADIDEGSLQNVPVLLADGSVTTAKLSDAAVTMPKLADAAVSEQKLAFDPATQSELDAATTAIPDSRLETITTPGKIADSALSSNVALLGGTQTYSGAKTFTDNVTLNLNGFEKLAVSTIKIATENGAPFQSTINNQTSSNTQEGASVFNSTASTGTTETLLNLANLDNQPVVAGLVVASPGSGGVTTGIDLSDPNIGTAVNIGGHGIATSGATISAAELNKLDGNPTRNVSLPIGSFLNLSTPATIDFNASDGTAPDFALVAGAPAIEYDDNAGAGGDSAFIGTTFRVPSDFCCGGEFLLRISKDGETATVAEHVVCNLSINGGAFSSEPSVPITGAAAQTTSLSPGGVLDGGDSVALRCRFGNLSFTGTQDDVIRVHDISFRYAATR